MAFAVAIAVAVFGAGIVLADAHSGHHALALAHVDDAYAARAASGNANSIHRTADQRAAVGHQDDLVVVQHGEARAPPPAPGEAHQLDALAAAAGHPVL